MIEEVANNKYYSFKVDRAKNRMWHEQKGYWPNVAAVPNYVEDSRKVVSMLTKGYTSITDSRTFKISPPEIMKLFDQAKEDSKGKLSKMALILSQDAVVNLKASKSTATQTFNIKIFTDLASAESWLDQKE